MNKKIKILIAILLIIVISGIVCICSPKNKGELITVKSEKELMQIYNGKKVSGASELSELQLILVNVFCMPFSLISSMSGTINNNSALDDVYDGDIGTNYSTKSYDSYEPSTITGDVAESATVGTSKSKDYSTTNIQVENVDEADITKTDGDYIYSISDDNVIITDVKNPSEVKIASKINANDGSSIPEDLILYKDTLVIILAKSKSSSSWYSYNNNGNTIVNIYNIESRENPKLIKSYEMYEPYYTSRCIDNKLYVISSGNLRKENNQIIRNYQEDNIEQEIKLENIKYMKDVATKKQTLISMVDLDNAKANINLNSYLIDISNAYVSENGIYLLQGKYNYASYDVPPVSSIFGLKGIIGAFVYNDEDDDFGYKTEIYKFDIQKDGQVKYSTKNKVNGRTINQYSLDEKNGHLRVALYDYDGTRIVILDENLKQIGITKDLAKGETMYSSRFMGDKAYLVTYKNMDPLFVVDLSDETNPQVLGQLKIPGYSTYLHPYDENHLIGIGMESEEIVNRNANGKVTSTSARIIGMKMALFDVTDVNNPIQISQTVIGDRRTTSAILTNPKALLFSKEKELIAIPVNNYSEDFEVKSSSDANSSIISAYTGYNKKYIAEGYFVYKINLDEGFKLKGIITHEVANKNNNKSYYYYNKSKLLRGMYIDNNLYTVSETAVKVNNIDTMEQIAELKLNKTEE